MSIYEIPGIVKYAWPLASIPNNIINGFKKTGICPYNKNIFTDEDFAPSYVTDRHLVENQEPAVLMHQNVEKENEPQPGPSNVHNVGQSIVTDIVEDPVPEFSPEIVRPLPKATPRQEKSTRRRVRKSAVLTDTPEKNALDEEQSNNKRKKEEISSKIKNKGKGKGKGKGKDQAKRKILQEKNESDDEEDNLEYYCIVCCDAYSKSQPREEWIECILCKNWAHSKCIKNINTVVYVCPNCDSDESCDDV